MTSAEQGTAEQETAEQETAEHGIADRSEKPTRATTRQAVTVAATLAVLTALTVIFFSFGTATDSQSIEGRTATSSQWLDDGEIDTDD